MSNETSRIDGPQTKTADQKAFTPEEELRQLLLGCKTREEAQRVTADFLKRRRAKDKGGEAPTAEALSRSGVRPDGQDGGAAIDALPSNISDGCGPVTSRQAADNSVEENSSQQQSMDSQKQPAMAAAGVLTGDGEPASNTKRTLEAVPSAPNGEQLRTGAGQSSDAAVSAAVEAAAEALYNQPTTNEADNLTDSESLKPLRTGQITTKSVATKRQQRQPSRRLIQVTTGNALTDAAGGSNGEASAADASGNTDGADLGDAAAKINKLALLANSPYANALRQTSQADAGITKVARLASNVKKVNNKARRKGDNVKATTGSTENAYSETETADGVQDERSKQIEEEGTLNASAGGRLEGGLEAISEAAGK